MTVMTLRIGRSVSRIDRVLLVILAILIVLGVFAPGQATASLSALAANLLEVAPFLLASVLIAAAAQASGADNLIARAFAGRIPIMIALAAIIGAVSPFCSCGVIPLIAALLAAGVPLPPVMAFWLSSPIMDPSMFVLTAGTLGTEFAVFKTVAAIAIGLIGGFGTAALMGVGLFANPLRPGVGDGGCAASRIRDPKAVVWRVWAEDQRRQTFARTFLSSTLFLGKWLTLAYLIESLMLAWIPAERVAELVGGDGWFPVIGATLVGIPAYLNGYAALPLVGGLFEQGMSAGAGMAFMIAGGVTCIPAMLAVYALVRLPVFTSYLVVALVGAFLFGAIYGLIA